MRTILMMGWVALLVVPGMAGDEEPYTPKPGSAERKAICDTLRSYTRGKHGVDPKLKFLWKIDELKVLGRHASFQGCAVNNQGGYLEHDSGIGDMEMTCFLRRHEGGWIVISDLSRGDVPSAEELKEIRAGFPKEIPAAILPEFWRGKLR